MFHNNGICGGCALVLVDVDDGLGIMGIACGFGGATAKVGPAFCHWLNHAGINSDQRQNRVVTLHQCGGLYLSNAAGTVRRVESIKSRRRSRRQHQINAFESIERSR